MLKHNNKAHTVMLEEDGFAIKAGLFGYYYIEHDDGQVKKNDPTERSLAYDITIRGKVIHTRCCKRCDKAYSQEMDGFINMLNWER